MLLIQKRSGRYEEFQTEKLKESLALASAEINEHMSQQDIQGVVDDLEEILSEKKSATTRQIYAIVIGMLAIRGFYNVAEEYLGFKKN